MRLPFWVGLPLKIYLSSNKFLVVRWRNRRIEEWNEWRLWSILMRFRNHATKHRFFLPRTRVLPIWELNQFFISKVLKLPLDTCFVEVSVSTMRWGVQCSSIFWRLPWVFSSFDLGQSEDRTSSQWTSRFRVSLWW